MVDKIQIKSLDKDFNIKFNNVKRLISQLDKSKNKTDLKQELNFVFVEKNILRKVISLSKNPLSDQITRDKTRRHQSSFLMLPPHLIGHDAPRKVK